MATAGTTAALTRSRGKQREQHLTSLVSFRQSSAFQTVTLDTGGANGEQLRFRAVGLSGATGSDGLSGAAPGLGLAAGRRGRANCAEEISCAPLYF